MTNAGLADQQDGMTGEPVSLKRGTVLKVFALIAVVSFLFRIVYAGHFYEDDGLWFTAAEEIVRGKALYGEIYFDKPPGLALTYALLFWVFGAHLITIRLFTIAYSVAVSAMLYLFGARLYDKHVGLLAAAIFAIFSTTYPAGHTQGLGTDLLMVLPYTAAAYLLIRSRLHWRRQAWQAAAGGALAGIAFQINPKAILGLFFFAIFLIVSRNWLITQTTPHTAGSNRTTMSRVQLFALAFAGFAAGSLPFVAYIAVTHSLPEYWRYVWDWGARYGAYYPVSKMILPALTRSLDYFALNNTLLVSLGFFVITMIRRARGKDKRGKGTQRAPEAGFTKPYLTDAALLIWFAVSYAGVMVGGRFFPHYFIQLLPSLCLIAARGLSGIRSELRVRSPRFRRAVMAILALGFAFTLVRFHGRGALLAADFVRGGLSKPNASWEYIVRDREERMVAAVVRDFPAESGDATQLGLEALRAGGRRTRAADGPADYVFVWGYRPEIYFWSGLLPASRYLSTQPLTGVPADVHYFSDEYRSLLDEGVVARARVQVVSDLEQTRPKYIVDEIGFFNADLAILKYSELSEFMDGYKPIGATGRFLLYVRKDLRGKDLLGK